MLDLSENQLTEIAAETFRNLGDLRIVDLSSNLLRTLPDSLFLGDDLSKLDVSDNQVKFLGFILSLEYHFHFHHSSQEYQHLH